MFDPRIHPALMQPPGWESKVVQKKVEKCKAAAHYWVQFWLIRMVSHNDNEDGDFEMKSSYLGSWVLAPPDLGWSVFIIWDCISSDEFVDRRISGLNFVNRK